MLLGKKQAGSALGYTWDQDNAVIEVDNDVAGQLLSIGHAGFYEIHPSARPEEPEPALPKRKPAPPAEERSSLADALDTVGVKPRGTRSRA